MEADWEVEIGNEAPVIDACWEGFVDLRRVPERAADLPEARECTALKDALIRLNSPSSPVWTSKCDVWRPAEFDADEMDAPGEAGKCALACYIDLLPRSDQQWGSPTEAVAACQALCSRIRDVPLRNCRADLVVRGALVAPERQTLGITAYLTACGSRPGHALAALDSALAAFADSVLNFDGPASAASKLQ